MDFTDRFKRVTRYLAPAEVKRRAFYTVSKYRSKSSPVEHETRFDNVYHCCVQKTASQWIRHILGDWRFYRYSGLESVHPSEVWPADYNTIPLTERHIETPFPSRTVVSPLYLDRPSFDTINKPEKYRAFFVTRDPRDIVVSYYFSTKNSHTTKSARVVESRRLLDELSLEEGLQWAVGRLEEHGLFDALRSWVVAGASDEHLVVKYEALTGSGAHEEFRRLMNHLDVRIPDDVLGDLLEDHAFERMAGREKGEENQFRHLRKGVSGDWVNYFDEAVTETFFEVTGDLVAILDYETDKQAP